MGKRRLFSREARIARPAQEVFDVYVDVENWPSWTASMSEVHRLDAGAVRVGARTRVRQPRLPAVEWTVTEMVPGESFTWESRRAGLITVARHRIRSEAGGCVVTAELEHQGLLAPLITAVSASITRRYLQMETDGLKARCERDQP